MLLEKIKDSSKIQRRYRDGSYISHQGSIATRGSKEHFGPDLHLAKQSFVVPRSLKQFGDQCGFGKLLDLKTHARHNGIKIKLTETRDILIQIHGSNLIIRVYS